MDMRVGWSQGLEGTKKPRHPGCQPTGEDSADVFDSLRRSGSGQVEPRMPNAHRGQEQETPTLEEQRETEDVSRS